MRLIGCIPFPCLPADHTAILRHLAASYESLSGLVNLGARPREHGGGDMGGHPGGCCANRPWPRTGFTRLNDRATVHDVNNTIANIFLSMAELLREQGENPYRIRAYTRAADTLAHMDAPIADLAHTGDLRTLPGIGKDLAEKIREYLDTGAMQAYEKLKTPLPPAIRQWVRLPGLSDPIVHDLYCRLGIQTLDDLETLARSHMLRTRPGVHVTAEEMLAAIQRLRADPTAP